MKQGNNICLKPSCVLNIPIDTYEKDFTFIVNGIEFKTSRFIADLLSPVICKNHINDRTMDTFTINTHTPGDFSLILNLINFDTQTFQNKEIPFISEVVEILNNESIEIENKLKITTDNVFDLLKIHEENKNFYSKNISEEIDFINTKKRYAAKVLKKPILPGDELNDIELKILSNAKSPAILNLVGYSISDNKLTIYTELIQNFQYFTKPFVLNMFQVKKFMNSFQFIIMIK